MDSAKKGHWINVPHENTIYIQITDPCCSFEPAQNNFAEIHRFEFLDDNLEGEGHEFSINDTQAEMIADILRRAYQSQQHVIVSCHAGLCRSGAITEIMVSNFGYIPGGTPRHPNLLVVHKVLKRLGLGYDPELSPFNELDNI